MGAESVPTKNVHLGVVVIRSYQMHKTMCMSLNLFSRKFGQNESKIVC